MTIDDQHIISAGIAAWAAALAAIAALWKRVRELEKLVGRLQSEKSEGAAALMQLEACPSPACPYREAFMIVTMSVCLSGCSAAPVPQHFDKRVLVVFRDETPRSLASSIAGILQPLTKIILP